MMLMTRTAVEKLRTLIQEHPDDPIVRVAVRDLDETRLSFTITLDNTTQPTDDVQEIGGLTIAVEGASAPRMDGITVDYAEPSGFVFLHPDEPGTIRLTRQQLN
ncbi:MAG: iron-sulfur cluster biosynthesis family protein [Nitrospiraceae bacterium]